jgi:hypothetical protein
MQSAVALRDPLASGERPAAVDEPAVSPVGPVGAEGVENPEGIDDVDRRADARLTLSELPWLERVRLKYGPTVTVLDLSAGGAQIETHGHRLNPGSTVVVEITGGEKDITAAAQVVRCELAGVSPQPIYRGGLAFRRPIALPEAPPDDDAGVDVNPAHEHARLGLALKRRAPDALAAVAPELGTALAILDSPTARRGGVAFSREVGKLFGTVAQALDQNVAGDELVFHIVEQVRRAVPAGMIRFVEGNSGRLTNVTVYFDVPGTSEEARLLVDFPRDARIEEWHFQYLRTAAQVLGAIRKIGVAGTQPDAVSMNAPLDGPVVDATEPDAGATEAPVGWHKVVARFLDGRALKGFCREFTASSSLLTVWPRADASSDQTAVPLAQLKAIFFVRAFEESPATSDDASAGAPLPPHGRRVAVTFVDGETLLGTTMNYSADAAGFFLVPPGRRNVMRVFVSGRAIRQVQFPT